VRKLISLLTVLLLASAGPSALAQRSGEIQRDHVVVELISEVEAIRPG